MMTYRLTMDRFDSSYFCPARVSSMVPRGLSAVEDSPENRARELIK
jgi:hypothetical protein